MAKKKRKKTKKKEKIVISNEIYAVFLVIAAILGLGKLGPVGKFIASLSLFVSGSIYMVLLLILLIIGVYTLIKREWPEFFTTKMVGI